VGADGVLEIGACPRASLLPPPCKMIIPHRLLTPTHTTRANQSLLDKRLS
jgi:hypothetical protein